MMDSPIVDVAMGLIFFYVLLSLVCSSVQEVIASIVGLRSRNLEKGIKNLVGNEYARALYEHPLIKGLRKPGKRPSYIKPEIFAATLLEVVARDKSGKSATELAADDLRETISKIEPANPTRDLLLSLATQGADAVDQLKQRVADWFDAGMDRVSGWYKRQVKYILLVIAAVVTISVNADSIRIAEQLWQNDMLRATIAAEAQKAVTRGDVNQIDPRKPLQTFPIWYPKGFPDSGLAFTKAIVGWMLTIAAISLGAPFWFDLLSKFAHLRGSGTRDANRAKDKT